MFDNIASLRFVKGPNNEPQAQAMISSEGEFMDFRTPVVADGRVEDWMTSVLAEMRKTNRLITKEAVFFYCANNQARYGVFLPIMTTAPDIYSIYDPYCLSWLAWYSVGSASLIF